MPWMTQWKNCKLLKPDVEKTIRYFENREEDSWVYYIFNSRSCNSYIGETAHAKNRFMAEISDVRRIGDNERAGNKRIHVMHMEGFFRWTVLP